MLSKKERDYLSKKTEFQKSYGRVLRHRIKQKLKNFYMLEMPLIQKSGITEFYNDITKNNNATVKDHKLRAGFDPATFTLPR